MGMREGKGNPSPQFIPRYSVCSISRLQGAGLQVEQGYKTSPKLGRAQPVLQAVPTSRGMSCFLWGLQAPKLHPSPPAPCLQDWQPPATMLQGGNRRAKLCPYSPRMCEHPVVTQRGKMSQPPRGHSPVQPGVS